MAIRKVHGDTARVARKLAQEELGVEKPKLRPATEAEHLKGMVKSGLNFQQIRDVVVVEDRKNGKEYLVGIDLDPAASRHLNAESGVLTLAGLIPVVGAPVVAAFAMKDIVKAGVPALKAKLNGEATSAKDRAILRMGVKHLGLAGLSMASLGIYGATHSKEVKSAAKAVKKGVQLTEVAWGTKDLADGAVKGSGLKGLAKSFAEGVKAIGKSVVVGLQGLAGVHHPEHHHKEDARLVFAQARPLGGGKRLPMDQQVRLDKNGKRLRPPPTGPPSVPDDVQ